MKKKQIAVLLLLLAAAYGTRNAWLPQHPHWAGTLEYTEHSLGARVPGRVDRLFVDEGSVVKRGQLLAVLDRYAKTRSDYRRTYETYRAGGVSRQALEEAALALKDQRITAPVNGVVLVKVREAGEIVGAGSPVFVVGDRSSAWVKIFIPEGIISRVRIGDPAEVRVDGLSKPYRGQVTFIAPKAEFTPRNIQTPEERITQVFGVKVTLNDPEEFLRPGVTGDVRFLAGAKK